MVDIVLKVYIVSVVLALMLAIRLIYAESKDSDIPLSDFVWMFVLTALPVVNCLFVLLNVYDKLRKIDLNFVIIKKRTKSTN